MKYQINEVDGNTYATILHSFNSKVEEWPELKEKHLDDGFWWLVYFDDHPIAFAGLVPFFPRLGYLKRCYVDPNHRGHSLQQRLLLIRENKAREIGWTHLYSECAEKNKHSACNFRRAGYQIFEPEQEWAVNSIYWCKEL